MIRAKNTEPEIIEYLNTPPSKSELDEILKPENLIGEQKKTKNTGKLPANAGSFYFPLDKLSTQQYYQVRNTKN